MKYSASLTKEEVIKFASEFFELEISRGSIVKIEPDPDFWDGLFLVSIRVMLGWEDLVEVIKTASPQNKGMLQYWEWGERFKRG